MIDWTVIAYTTAFGILLSGGIIGFYYLRTQLRMRRVRRMLYKRDSKPCGG